jgi:HEAT repeat protein
MKLSKKRRAQLQHIIAQYERTRQFPGFAACLDMLDAGAEELEWGLSILRNHAPEHVAEFIQALQAPEHESVRWLLLEAVGATHSDAVVPLLATYLQGSDSDLWGWAIRALLEIDTKESRRALWDARSYVFATDEETVRFQERLAEVMAERPKPA